MSEIDRLYSYRTLLTGRRAVPRDEILNKLEISPATFKRDLAKLRDRLNIPVVFDRDLGGYRLDTTDARQELPGLWFSQDEVLALLTIQNMLEQLEPGLLGPKLKPLQKRLDEMLTGQGMNAETLSLRVRLVHAGKRNLKLKCFEQIAHSTLHRKQINIHHFNRQSGKTVERIISPQQLVHYRDNWYVDAWCHLRKEVRSFAVDAITDCEQLTLDAKELDSELLRNSMQGGYGIFGGVVKSRAKLKFSPERARWVQNEEWHPDQVGEIQNDGSYVLELPYSDERELIGDLLKYGSSVEVLSPKDLRSKVKDEIQKAIRVYE
jgi:predicted DNA-binding transcriptional regulator YafY